MTYETRAWAWRWCVMIVVATLGITRPSAEWRLWPSPTDDMETPDQGQGDSTETTGICDPTPPTDCPIDTYGSGAVGQQFLPTSDTIYRIDFRLNENWDVRPATFRLWEWHADRATTVQATPLYYDKVSMGGGITSRDFSVFPRVSVTTSQLYYFEIGGEGRDLLTVSINQGIDDDSYEFGKAWVRGSFRDFTDGGDHHHYYDLDFQTYGSPQGTPSIPSLTPSDATLAWYPPDEPCSVLTAGCPGYQVECPGENDLRWPSNVYSKCDYYRRAKDYLDYERSYFESCGKDYGQGILINAILYEDSCRRGACNEDLAQETAEMMLERYDYQFCQEKHEGPDHGCDCNEKSGTDWFEHVGVAYQLIKDSTVLRQQDRERIRCVMVDSAKKFWPKREAGAGNRPLAAATMLLLTTMAWEPFEASQECPNIELTAEDRDKWYAFAEVNWTTFWDARNWGSDSGNYIDNVTLRIVLEYAYFSGRDTLVWSDSEFRKLVENIYLRFSPLGITGNFGETGGVGEQQTALVWFFEKAANKYAEPKYKWLAHQLLRYNETRQCDSPPTSDSYVNGISDLALGYLDSDDAISDAAPASQSEMVSVSQTDAAVNHDDAKLAQTFNPTASPLVRVDLLLTGNHGDTTPATVKLWRWQSNYATTVAQTPLFQDTLSTSPVNATRSIYPFLDVDTTATYLVEVSRSTQQLIFGGSSPTTDLYPDGQLYTKGIAVPSADLWFQAFSLTPNGSTYTTRLAVTHHTPSNWSVVCNAGWDPYCNRWFDFGTSIIPDKLILRSGYEPNDLFALFTLTVNGFDHGDWNPGALSLLTNDASVLMAETPIPYFNTLPQSVIDNTTSQVARYWGGAYSTPQEQVAVTRFSDARRATVAFIDWADVHGWQVGQQRRIFFVKDRFLWIRDRFAFPLSMNVAVGTTWHAGDIHPTTAANWFQLYYRQPQGNVWEQRNNEAYVSLYFMPRGSETVAAVRETTYDPQPPECTSFITPACGMVWEPGLDCRSGPPFVVNHRWKGDVEAGDQRYMDALLIPHALPRGVPPQVTTLYDDGRNVAIRVVIDGETWVLVDNPGGNGIDGDGIATDARYLIARTSGSLYLLTYDASQVEISSGVSKTWPVRTSVEIGGY